MHIWDLVRRRSLEGDRTRDFAAIFGNEGIQRHILGFERRDGKAPISEKAAQPADNCRLASIRTGRLNHDRPHLRRQVLLHLEQV